MPSIVMIAISIVLMLPTGSVLAAEYGVPEKGGVVGNSYASQMVPVGDNLMRITTRKREAADPAEVNTPGTSAYKAFQAINNAASLRAAVEAKSLGYKIFKVVSATDKSRLIEKRNASGDLTGDGLNESNFIVAPGNYTNDLELAVEMTVELIPGEMPENPPIDYADVEAILVSWGLAE